MPVQTQASGGCACIIPQQVSGFGYIASRVDGRIMRGGPLHVSPSSLHIGTWNVEGLSDDKILALQEYIAVHGIHIICMQEVRKPLSDHIITDQGFLLICSGGDGSSIEYAGVGFLVHPSIRKSIHNVCQYCNRIACIELRTPGGKIATMTSYVPHAKKPFEERFDFFQSLASFWQSISVNGPRFSFGDFDSRLYVRLAGEEHFIGPHFFRNPCPRFKSDLNRFLLL